MKQGNAMSNKREHGICDPVRRPADATHNSLRKCLHWLDECRKLGWAEDVMPNLEAMFWQYYDSDGNKKSPNEKDQR
jgi:hypothetical protein